MARKTKAVKEEIDKVALELENANLELKRVAEKAEELVKLKEQAEQEEIDHMESTKQAIIKLAEDAGFYCGLILTKQDILNVVAVSMNTNESVTIDFNLYPKE